MSTTEESPRRTRDGGYIVAVDTLRVGDRLRFAAAGQHAVWWPIVHLEELPKTRRVTVGTWSTRMARTTLVARAPRQGEQK
jgi:hypothetical protein